jgi:predicted nucleic acid-binding protein
MAYLIDTCIWVDVERGKLAPADIQTITGSESVYLSPITVSELQFGVDMATDPGIRQARQKSVDILKKKPVLKIDEETGSIHGRLGAELRKSGKDGRYRIMDLWLAAQAIQYNLVLLTRNSKDFSDISGLQWQELPRSVQH